MLTFPYVELTDAPSSGAPLETRFPTSIVESETGVEQRRGKAVYPRLSTSIRYNRDTNAATRANAIWDFYRQCRGPLLPFVYFDFDAARTWTRVQVGIATAGQTVFTLPSIDATSVTVYVNGTSRAGTFLARGGANGRDKFTFTVAATLNDVVEVTFTGRIAVEMRFEQETFSYTAFTHLLYEVGLSLIQVRGES